MGHDETRLSVYAASYTLLQSEVHLGCHEEAGKSRIYGGIHYEFDNEEGLLCGRAAGNYVYRHYLLPRTSP